MSQRKSELVTTDNSTSSLGQHDKLHEKIASDLGMPVKPIGKRRPFATPPPTHGGRRDHRIEYSLLRRFSCCLKQDIDLVFLENIANDEIALLEMGNLAGS